MRYAFQFKINCKGGIISPGFLLNVLDVLEKASIEHIRFGLRQQILIDASIKQYHKLCDLFQNHQIDYEINTEKYPNIVSSYAAENIFVSENWLKEGVYKDILDEIDYSPTLKINFSDNDQCFTPFFSGHINWIASTNQHFWHLNIRFPKTNFVFQWPQLIYTNNVANMCKWIENSILENLNKPSFFKNGENIYKEISTTKSYIQKPIEIPLKLPTFNLPYYEGFNSYGNKTWLGIYRRDELFVIKFLKEIALTCLHTKIGQLYTTPWKSLIVKNIEKKDRIIWDTILGKYRINVRHAANELNWQIEDDTEDGLHLKRYLIREFDKQDVRTYGLCFAIKTKENSNLYGSVLIERNKPISLNKTKQTDNYTIYYTENFNPNNKNYIVYRENVAKEHIHVYLISLCKYFYETMYLKNDTIDSYAEQVNFLKENLQKKEFVYQCKDCLSIYDEQLGDTERNIAPATSFSNLPSEYCCATCEAPLSNFQSIPKDLLFATNI